ncbi:MAG: acetyl-CoA hydrolase/transferase family protein [Myxococcota bacterium]
MGSASIPTSKRLSAAEAAERVRDRDTLAIPLGPGQPPAFLHALGERPRFSRLRVFGAFLTDWFLVFTRPGVELQSGFFGPVERQLLARGHRVEFVPGDFRRFEAIVERFAPRVMATLAAPPDDRGCMSLSLHAGATVEALHRAGADPDRLLIVEINPGLPRTLGLPPAHPHALSIDEVDIVISSERPVFTLPDPEPGALDREIAGHALAYIDPGCTLQTGIGGVPNEIAGQLAAQPGGDYGIHTEMFTTGLMRLHRAGKVSNLRKGVHEGYSVTTFAAGTRELYDWLDGTRDVRFLPVERVNDPAVIAAHRKMVSINGALAVDLAGQVAADTVGFRQHSGIGGHLDFTGAASRSPGGRSLVCLPSTARTPGERVSRIAAQLAPGTRVTTPRHEVDVVITEWGAAELGGRSHRERAEALIAIAHPEHREALREAWAKGSGSGGG